ncbi:hypothetical protein [Collimonas sp. PA-H2]|uniref:hypothetical protein n=1 Tax=Collimonas sp. PA-H2 TaxID=1881062 RepID=UPI000BF8C7C9|nr:hypothetical protein [Collimonas sp. PA-H2]
MKSTDEKASAGNFPRGDEADRCRAHVDLKSSSDTRTRVAVTHVISPACPLFHFDVSLNEEHTWLQVACNGQPVVDLGERIHHYSLLTLARHRLHDANRGYEADSQGWIGIEQLSKMLGLDTGYLNIQIFRARQQLKKFLPDAIGSGAVIERRRGEIRFGGHAFRIMRGAKLEGEFMPQSEEQKILSQLPPSAMSSRSM